MGEKYSDFLDDLTTRADLNRVLQWMSSELAVGHHRNGGGDTLIQGSFSLVSQLRTPFPPFQISKSCGSCSLL